MKLETKVFYISKCVIINSGKWYQNEHLALTILGKNLKGEINVIMLLFIK